MALLFADCPADSEFRSSNLHEQSVLYTSLAFRGGLGSTPTPPTSSRGKKASPKQVLLLFFIMTKKFTTISYKVYITTVSLCNPMGGWVGVWVCGCVCVCVRVRARARNVLVCVVSKTPLRIQSHGVRYD